MIELLLGLITTKCGLQVLQTGHSKALLRFSIGTWICHKRESPFVEAHGLR